MDIDQARAAYRSDPHFHAAVDAMLAWIRQTTVTPSEVRAAAMLACIIFEEQSVRFRGEVICGGIEK